MGTAWESLREMQMFSGLDGLVQWGKSCFAASCNKVGLRYNAATVTCQCCTKSWINTFCCHLLATKVPLFPFWEPGGWRSMCKCESRVIEGNTWLLPAWPWSYPWIKSLSPALPAPEHYWPLNLAQFPVFCIIQSSSAAWTGHAATRSRSNTLLWVHVSASHSCSFPPPWQFNPVPSLALSRSSQGSRQLLWSGLGAF